VTTRSTLAPQVVLRDGDDASGMATMLAGLLSDNLRDFPGRARVAAQIRGALVLTASDRDLSITISFRRGDVEVADGTLPGAPTMAGPWLAMSRVCSGRISPLRALIDRELTLGPGRRIWMVPAGGYVLSVPASFYGDTDAIEKRRMIVLGTAGGAAVTLATVLMIRHRLHRRSAP
jgi:hypothetical protein